MATIRDIAAKLGVSPGTVSKGLNGASDVSAELRRQILDTAVELGYSSRRARSKESRRLAVFVENMAYEKPDDFGYQIALGFQKAAYHGKWGAEVIPLDRTLQESERYDTYMTGAQLGGAFFLGLSLEDPWLEQFSSTIFPTVLLDNTVRHNSKVASLGTDSEEAMQIAVDHLVSLGHEKIAFLNGSAGSLISDQRMLSYLSAMASHRLTIDPNLAIYGYFVQDTARYHVPGFLNKGVTAILCGNDLIAAGVIETVRSLGFRVPEDISVIGYDDVPLAETTDPPLTTIRQNLPDLGSSAYYTLRSLMDGVSISRTLLRPSMILRSTTAPASPRIIVSYEDDLDNVLHKNPALYNRFLTMRGR